MIHREHPSRVVRLVDGQLVGYPLAAEEDCTLWFALPDKPGEWEGILGKRQSEDTAEVVGVPVFIYDVGLGDVVRTVKSAEGADVVTEIVADGGTYTFRAFFESESFPSEHWKVLMSDLETFGCWFDTWSETVVAISADLVNSQAVADYLATRENRGELRYETGRSR
jgi:Domain of unknown function (DUF4265)